MSTLSKARIHQLLELAQRLIAAGPVKEEGEPGNGIESDALVRPFLGVLGINAVWLYDAASGRFLSTEPPGEWEGPVRATYVAGQDQDDAAAGVIIRRLVVSGRIAGAVAFRGLEEPRLTAEPVISLAGALLERLNLTRRATAAMVAAEIAGFRSAFLETLGSETKNALTTILAATGGLREAGPLRPEQLEMARMVEEEASRLGRVISRLDWIARLDEREISPATDTTNITALVAQVTDQWARVFPDRRVLFTSASPSFLALADPELVRIAVTQLLDNAGKFSAPGAAVRVEVSANNGSVVVNVASEGSPLPMSERSRIFERSYLGARGANFAAGSGLGLYAARKIALAHGGTLELDPLQMPTDCIAFRLSLPRVRE